MRPIAIQRSVLQYPLDAVFSSSAHVRLIRVLAHEVDAPMGVSHASTLAGLTRTGARAALRRLEQAGIVECVGTGRSLKWRLRQDEWIAQPLRTLFLQEQERFDLLIGRLRKAVAMPELHSAWIERLPLTAKEPLQIDAVTEAKALSWVSDELSSRFNEVGKAFDLLVEASVFTPADAPSPGADALLLWGATADTRGDWAATLRTHADADERQLRAAGAIADLLRSDPSLVRRALHHLNRLLHEGEGNATRDVSEWRQLLETYSAERIRDLLVSTSPRAQRLRQSSPFFAVLTADERDQVFATMEEDHEA